MLGQLHWIDWAVLLAYIAGTSWFADRLADRKQTIRDFFLGGRKLPWWAVSGSIVASEVSGVTFVAIPAIAFAQGGNYTYMMLALGSILARVLIGYFIIPAYYRHEVYSPYELMGLKLGARVTRIASTLFMVGVVLGQGARLFLAAIVLDAITAMGILPAILLLSVIGVAWTWIGGITSVVWTDVVQFVMIVFAAIAAIVAVVVAVPGGVDGIVEAGRAAGKFQLWSFSTDPRAEFTFWCGIFGFTFLTLGSHGTDQMTAQRFFCCRDQREARKAVLWSSVAMLIPLMMLTVGIGLYAYYQAAPMNADEAARVAGRPDYVFPLFILRAMPIGIKGLFFASIFAAATQTAAISAMAQTALSFYRGVRRDDLDDRHLVRVSRLFVVLSGIAICILALVSSQIQQYRDLFRLAMAMASYTYGAMLGILLLALLPGRRDARGLVWGIPFTLLLVFTLNWQHEAWARWLVTAATVAVVVVTLPLLRRELAKIPWVLLGAAIVLLATWAKVSVDGAMQPIKVAFPWTFPLGTALTSGLGLVLARRVVVQDVPVLTAPSAQEAVA
ncbi:MAG TPA: sodium/solute symporter [Gemmatimonadaceae bacterium]|nr:sodium/solute symporter [Gemmatimonadaceae bacterium]